MTPTPSPTVARPVAALEGGMTVSLFLGGAVAPGCVAVSTAHGYVVSTTEKAVRLRFDVENPARNRNPTAPAFVSVGEAWFPRKAIVDLVADVGTDPRTGTERVYGYRAKLAKWFRVDGHTAHVLERACVVSGVSA